MTIIRYPRLAIQLVDLIVHPYLRHLIRLELF